MSTRASEDHAALLEPAEKLDVVVIVQDLVSVLTKPKGGSLACQLRNGIFIICLCRKQVDGVQWIQTYPGWICASDIEGNPTCEEVYDVNEAIESWRSEESKRKRMASAIACELVKSHPLSKAKRFVGSLTKHAVKFYPEKPMVKIKNIGVEDIMISLGGQMGLTKQQIFEYIKVTASQQCNPPQAVLDIIAEINHLITFRPTQWVAYDLNVLETEDVRRNNDRFVMLAASGKLEEFKAMVERGHELTCLHSELKYTALHGAADFGQVAVVEYIITTGVSLNMKDPRKKQTALHVAAYNGREGVVKVLLAANADRKIADIQGNLAYYYADMQGHFEVRELLKYLPPTVRDLKVIEATISSITVQWTCPEINPTLHSEITEYFVDCLPVGLSPDEELTLAPVPCTPALPPVNLQRSQARLVVRPQIDYIYQKYLDVSITSVMFSNLLPSSEYTIRAKSCSLSGWSRFSPEVTQRTHCYVPEPPDPVDIIKVSSNGLLLAWNKPFRDNGHKVDYYQIELIDAKMAIPLMIEEELAYPTDSKQSTKLANLGTATTGAVKHATSSSIVSNNNSNAQNLHKLKRLPLVEGSAKLQPGVASRFHRFIKHKKLKYLFKYVTGLEPHRPYQCRIRAHNLLGYSPWSSWTGPIAPHIGVTIVSFAPERLSATLTWFSPLLALPSRRLEAYELQMCCLRGPLTKSIEVLATAASNGENDSSKGSKSNKKKSTKEGSKQTEEALTAGRRRRSDSTSSTESDDSLAWHSLPTDQDDFAAMAAMYQKTDALLTAKPKDDDESNEFVTLRDDLTENIYEVTGLKAGSRYKVRVRCKISDQPEWSPWDSAVLSDIFSMPATPPDPPFLVRAAASRAYSSAVTTAAATAVEAHSASLAGSSEYVPCDVTPIKYKPPRDPLREKTIFDCDYGELMAQAQAEIEAEEAARLAENLMDIDAQSTPPSVKIVPSADGNAPVSSLSPRMLSFQPPSTDKRVNQVLLDRTAAFLTVGEGSGFDDNDDDVVSTTADSASMGVQMQSVTSSVIARRTDVDIKSGKLGFDGAKSTLSIGGGLSGTFGASDELQLEITHDSITITWQNGQANGLPVEEFVVECARVRTYRLVDVVRARDAYINVIDTDEVVEPEESVSTVTAPPVTTSRAHPAEAAHALDAHSTLSALRAPGDCWEWQDITTTGGRFLGFQKFRAESLIPGCTYIFRVKQRNACGWSEFSGASRMIATYPSVPPGVPTVFMVRSTYAAVRWLESDHPRVGLTNLEYEVQLGVVSHTLKADAAAGEDKSSTNTTWNTVEVRYFPAGNVLLQALLHESGGSSTEFDAFSLKSQLSSNALLDEAPVKAYVHVMLQNLVSHIAYVIRVRVRTVFGWSPWSKISEQFRTEA